MSTFLSLSLSLSPQNWYSPLLVACLAGERCNDAVEVLLTAGADCNGHSKVSYVCDGACV